MLSDILLYILFAIIVAIWGVLVALLKRLYAVMKGTQALLRDRLYDIYYTCMKKGYATTSERNNFENVYIQYHALGKNGVMESYRKQLLALPYVKGKYAKSV